MIEYEQPSPNEIEIPVYVGEEIIYMTPPEYYGWFGNLAIKHVFDEEYAAE